MVSGSRNRQRGNAAGRDRRSLVVVEQLDQPGSNRGSPTVRRTANAQEDFDMWMRMATDNKINAINSWNFALIDYFHDLNVLRDGDGINFQKASATLDGCVKVYSSRVDSVATETGRLLNGLATSAQNDNGDGNLQDDNDDENEGDDDDDEELSKKRSRKGARSEVTLVSDFNTIRIKKLEKELTVDPIFKKALADFDEGGAKSLLLNALSIDKTGRIVFDGDETNEIEDKTTEEEEKEQDEEMLDNVDLKGLKDILLEGVEESTFNSLEICPYGKQLEAIIENENAENLLQDFEKIDINDGSGFSAIESVIDDAGIDFGGYDNDDFDNDGGDAPNMTVEDVITTDFAVFGQEDDSSNQYTLANEALMSYFDKTMKKNWAGPEHWKIQKLRKSTPFVEGAGHDGSSTKNTEKKEKEYFEIDFLSTDDQEDDLESLFAPGSNITLPKTQWVSKTKNLLPDDRHFSSRDLLYLFVKPRQPVAIMLHHTKRAPRISDDSNNTVPVDENFWANNYKEQEQTQQTGNDNDDFFQDAGGVDMSFDDNDNEIPTNTQLNDADLGSQLISGQKQIRPEYVNYARVAKKVDVKLLKDNIWKCMSDDKVIRKRKSLIVPQTEEPDSNDKSTQKFSEVVSGLSSVYTPEMKSELSTSFCFICLLHLANENGLNIENTEDNKDLIIHNIPVS